MPSPRSPPRRRLGRLWFEPREIGGAASRTRLVRWAVLSLVVGSLGWAGPIVAQRATGHLHLDGKLDDEAWAAAPVYDAFVENFPHPGAAPDLRTEVRVLFDDSSLYVGVRCFDPQPDRIVRSLGRRDATPPSDLVEVAIDASGDHRTAYDFIVNAAGLQRDVMLFGDFNNTDTWDAVWDGEASVDPGGWSAEYRIPLRILRITKQQAAWRIEVRRTVNRTHQVFESTAIPREANTITNGALVVSRFGTLEGLSDLEPTRDVELTPYLAGRAALRPQFSDGTTPEPRLWDPSFDLGADLKLALTSRLSLNATLNPDFGQVEADQVIQNLSTAEAWFPEKRPFFTQGLDLFQPVGAEYGSPQQMFYSRRIGLQTPILGAVKMTGSLTDSLDVGVLDSLVLGASNPAMAPAAFADLSGSEETSLTTAQLQQLARLEATPDRRWALHAVTPFHLGPDDALPTDRPTPRNAFAAVARQRLGDASSVGAILTASTPLAPLCTRQDFTTDAAYAQAGCQSRGVNALALDWNLRTASGEWGFFGQVEASQQTWGQPSGRLLADGTVMKPGDLGFGGYLRAGKLSGEPFRYDVSYVLSTAKLDLNGVGMGFQPRSNMQWLDGALHYTRPNGVGPLRSLNLDAYIDLNWSADGLWAPRGINANLHGEAQLPSFEVLGVQVGYENPQFDAREISQAGVPFQRLTDLFVLLYGQTDSSKPFFIYADAFGARWFGQGLQPGTWGGGADLSLRWQPVDALETRLDGSFGYRPLGARYLDTLSGLQPSAPDQTDWLFGSQTATLFSVTLRQQVVLTPRLSFQVYAQLFTGGLQYGQYWAAPTRAPGQSPVGADQLVPVGPPSDPYDTHVSTLNLNAVVRWEYRLGSTLFLVYTRSQQERVLATGERASSSVFPSQLFAGPAVDTFLIKFTYWWNV
jgi:Domain of unknown function (DUF5916)/Carbohydrate family 9 binding domain-like